MTIRRLILVLLVAQAELLAIHFGALHVAPMAIVLVEGWDHLAASQFTSKGWSANPTAVVSGRFDGQAASLNSNVVNAKQLPSTYTTLWAGVAFQPATVAVASYQFLRFQSSASAVIAYLRVNSSGQIEVLNSSNTIIATGTTVLTAGVWVYVEAKLVVNGAAGSITVHLNGVSEIAVTTGNFGSTAVGWIAVVSSGVNGTHFDDLYVLDGTGSAPNNGFLGDVRVETIYPNGAGAHTAWTPNGAASNYQCVDEATPDGDTSYVSDATVGDIDTYTFSDIDAGATVFAVQRNVYMRKDDANVRQVAMVERQAGTDHVGATQTQGSSYAVASEIENADPTGAPWTAATINGNEWGVKVIA